MNECSQMKGYVMGIGAYHGSDIEDYPENEKEFSFKNEIERIKELPPFVFDRFVVETKYGGRKTLKVMQYSEKDGENFLVAYHDECKTMYIRKMQKMREYV